MSTAEAVRTPLLQFVEVLGPKPQGLDIADLTLLLMVAWSRVPLEVSTFASSMFTSFSCSFANGLKLPGTLVYFGPRALSWATKPTPSTGTKGAGPVEGGITSAREEDL